MPELETIYFARIDSMVVGPLLLACSEKGLRRVQFYKGTLPNPGKDETWIESPEHLRPYIAQLESYFRGELRAFIHHGFWHPLDTLRDKNFLEESWQRGDAPWKLWS